MQIYVFIILTLKIVATGSTRIGLLIESLKGSVAILIVIFKHLVLEQESSLEERGLIC